MEFYQIYPWPTLLLSRIFVTYTTYDEHYTVAKPGQTPIFQNGTYHWNKKQAKSICDALNNLIVPTNL